MYSDNFGRPKGKWWVPSVGILLQLEYKLCSQGFLCENHKYFLEFSSVFINHLKNKISSFHSKIKLKLKPKMPHHCRRSNCRKHNHRNQTTISTIENTDNGSTESRLVRVRTFWTGSICRFLRCCTRRRIRRECQAATNQREGSGSNQGSLASETSLSATLTKVISEFFSYFVVG